MIPLPKISKKWNFEWEVVERSGDYAIMKQTQKGSLNYNVIKIIKAPEAKLGKNTIPAKEKIPADSQWGTYAWNFGRDLEKAREKFNSLIK
jgi:hypothetical protein